MEDERSRRGASLDVARVPSYDRVFVHDLVLDVEIGVYTNEKGVTQRVRISVDVDVTPAPHAVEDVARRCLAHPRAARVKVTIEKLDKEPGAVGVEIVRTRAEG